MSETITRKKYYKLSFVLDSPLSLGSGDNDRTDRDLIVDSAGKPYIPASSLAGVVREFLWEKDKELAAKYLGDPSKISESGIIFYDATISSGKWNVSIRDSVALDEYKTAKQGAKFDMEVLEPGVEFTTYLEQDFSKEMDYDFGRDIVKAFLSGFIVLGGKGMRGYGHITNFHVYEITFEFPKDMDSWLSFDVYSSTDWKECSFEIDKGGLAEIKLGLRLLDGISIRRYTTRPSSEGETEPDMEQLTLSDDIPVIPGTSWAGAIRHRMREFGVDSDIFGYVNGNKKDSAKARSKIVFSESRISDETTIVLSRNAIDRFSGGTVEGALFTERICYGGNTELVIGWRSKDKMRDREMRALAAALTDLHFGLLAVGGETSIGRGLFQIKKIDGKSIPADIKENGEEVYKLLLSGIEEVFG